MFTWKKNHWKDSLKKNYACISFKGDTKCCQSPELFFKEQRGTSDAPGPAGGTKTAGRKNNGCFLVTHETKWDQTSMTQRRPVVPLYLFLSLPPGVEVKQKGVKQSFHLALLPCNRTSWAWFPKGNLLYLIWKLKFNPTQGNQRIKTRLWLGFVVWMHNGYLSGAQAWQETG